MVVRSQMGTVSTLLGTVLVTAACACGGGTNGAGMPAPMSGGSGGRGGAGGSPAGGSGGSPAAGGAGGSRADGSTGSAGSGGSPGTSADAAPDPGPMVDAMSGGGSDGSPTPPTGSAGFTISGRSVVYGTLVFGGVRGMANITEAVEIKNTGGSDLMVTAVKLEGDPMFKLKGMPGTATLKPTESLSIDVVFMPPGSASAGVHRGMLSWEVKGQTTETVTVGVSGLVSVSGGSGEPPLDQMFQAFNLGVEAGWSGLQGGTAPEPKGDEIMAQRFERATDGPITVLAIAFYAPNERMPFGYYRDEGGIKRTELGAMRPGNQRLMPPTDPAGPITFDPGATPFGFYSVYNGTPIYTEDAVNRKAGLETVHSVRVYPVRDAEGKDRPNTYVFGFEEIRGGDYNDYVYIITNVKPAN